MLHRIGQGLMTDIIVIYTYRYRRKTIVVYDTKFDLDLDLCINSQQIAKVVHIQADNLVCCYHG